jgi:hypothetical protein
MASGIEMTESSFNAVGYANTLEWDSTSQGWQSGWNSSGSWGLPCHRGVDLRLHEPSVLRELWGGCRRCEHIDRSYSTIRGCLRLQWASRTDTSL